MSSAAISQYFSELHTRFEIAHRAQTRIDRRLATQFNPLLLLRPSENQLSRLLADLLDPKGSHGQGDAFLSTFIGVAQGSAAHAAPLAGLVQALRAPDARVKVQLEVLTLDIPTRDRRIDILVRIGGCALAIENKPWATDQTRQISDYMDHLTKNYALGNAVLIYLNGSGAQAPAHSFKSGEVQRQRLISESHFIEMSYSEHLLKWLRECDDLCEAEPVSQHLRQLIAFITSQFPRTR